LAYVIPECLRESVLLAYPAKKIRRDVSEATDTVVGMRKDLTILRDRRFGLLFAARTASVLGSAFGPVALAFGVLALPGATATTLSLVTAAEAITLVAFMLVGGVIADRLPRFRVMVAADLGAALAWGALAVMLLTGWAPLGFMIAASGLAGMATALFYPALTGVVPEVVASDRLQSANGILRLGQNLARIGGFAVAGGAVAVVGAGWAMALNAVLLVASAGLLAGLRLPSQRETTTSTSMMSDLQAGWKEFRSRQWLWVVVLQYSFVMMVLQAVFSVLGPVVANDRLGGAAGWSWVLAAESIGMVVGVVIAIRVKPRYPIRQVVLLTFPLAGLPLVLGLGAPLPVAVAVALVAGIAIDVLVVFWDTTMQREIPAEALSRVSSYDALGTLLLGPVGLLLAGPSVDRVGASPALLFCAAVTVLASAAALCAPGVRNLRWTTERPRRDIVALDVNRREAPALIDA
jgi:MFS family permease